MMDIENYCSKCGTKLRPQARFCEGCGKKIQISYESKEQLVKEIEQEIKAKTRQEVLAEIQINEARQKQEAKGGELSKKKSTQGIVVYKKGDWKYALILITIIFVIILYATWLH